MNPEIQSKINGLVISPLKQIEDERGDILHMLRSDSPLFSKFGEVYFSNTNPGVIKAWKRHKKMTQLFALPVGRIRLVVFDDRSNSLTKGQLQEIILGRPDKYYLVCIPPMLWYGFQGISEIPALMVNCSDIPHDPNESEQLPFLNDHIFFDWKQV
ncbi:MAG: dTDP-4-dehydrorhamnose 3,5-epimerase [Planctomycetes bacterium]|nr:dTDP-4-dehydrorhamnose 3,5-epimerase [Planctomycetota bacterium]